VAATYVAVRIGAALVFFAFPRKAKEGQPFTSFARADAEAQT
jgi:hypothetical protein